MSDKIANLSRMINFYEQNGNLAEADMLRQIRTLLHDSSVIVKYVIDKHAINPGVILDYGTTTVGNVSAELSGFFNVGS